MELPLLVERVISFSWTKCIAEAPLYTHSGTPDIVSFKLSLSAIAQDEKVQFHLADLRHRGSCVWTGHFTMRRLVPYTRSRILPEPV